jgi:ParB/RepB/Spo0J family partition protein
MVELRSVDPKILVRNPLDPRRTEVPQAMDDQLLASIMSPVGIIQPPRVAEQNGKLTIIAGNRRVKAAIKAGFAVIDVVVGDPDELADPMRSVSENLIRCSMTSVDIWRAVEALEVQGWNEQAIADALALPVRTIKRLKLLAHLPSAMLDVMAQGTMPSEDQLRTIAAAKPEEQAQVWKKYKPKKGHTDVPWHEVARALGKRRIPFATAKFGEDLTKAYGIVWEDDLFVPAGEDGRYTTMVDAFFGAQTEWLQNNMPPQHRMLPTDEHGHIQLPKGATHVYGKPGKRDWTGQYLDPTSGEVKSVVYNIPEKTKPGKPGTAPSTDDDDTDARPKQARPDLTQKGTAIIGDLRTNALHQALEVATIDDQTLLGMMILAFAGKNVQIDSPSDAGAFERTQIANAITNGGNLSGDPNAIRAAARKMLTTVLSCRENRSDSGILARIAGDAIGASLYLPSMATDEFLSCLSKAALNAAAATHNVRVEPRAKDTRSRMVHRFANTVYVYPDALFQVTAADLEKARTSAPRNYVPGRGWITPHEAGEDTGDGEAGPSDRAEDETSVGDNDNAQTLADAAE